MFLRASARLRRPPFSLGALLLAALMGVTTLPAAAASSTDPVTLEAGWAEPPPEARLRAYWWWLNGNVTAEAITHDLEEMKAKGFGGALLCDAGGADQAGNAPVPAGPVFFSAEWRELYRHTLREAARLGLEISLNIQSGWNVGGPLVPAEDAVKKLTWSEASAELAAPGSLTVTLPPPATNDGFYRDLYVLAWREHDLPATTATLSAGASTPARPPLANLEIKTLQKKPSFKGKNAWFIPNSALQTAPFLAVDASFDPAGADVPRAEVHDLTGQLAADGTLVWAEAPAGRWRFLRVGATLGDLRHVSTHSAGWKGYALDVLDESAFRRYWDAVVAPLIADAGPLAGTTLRYLHTDSWEIGVFNWTPALRAEFLARRGYDLLPWLPVFAGRVVESRAHSDRFLRDFRRTLGDLAADHHYRPFSAWAAKHGLGIHPESGGPHFTPIDAQQCLAINDVPMSEFWAEATTHRNTDDVRFFVKQPASAAHVAGHRLVAAEGFTTVGPHWQERLWDNLKPSFDQACTEGLNRLVWHAFVCSPREMGLPGQQYFAGTHLNPQVTWWEKSAPFFTYLNRCQFLLQRGRFVADALHYYGDEVPNFTRLRDSDPARLGPGYDYDVIHAEALLTRVSVRDGRLVLPDGVSYRVLVLPDQPAISLPVLRKVRELVAAGATIIGPRPLTATGLTDYPRSAAEVREIAAALWDGPASPGRVIPDRTARQVLLANGVRPDFEFTGGDARTDLRYIHRHEDDTDTDLYFVASRFERPETIRATFRVAGKTPELWDAVTGERRAAAYVTEPDGRLTVPLELPPCGSVFVVFRPAATPAVLAATPPRPHALAPTFTPRLELPGPWSVAFDPRWGGPAEIVFAALESWTARAEPGVRFYSGTATYRQTFELPAALADRPLALDLGDVRELAEIRLNGRSLGVVWAPPFRVDISTAVRPGTNQLEVEVVNFWPNRIIGDAALPPEQRLTRTNVRKLTAQTPLMESGLLGPVRLLERISP